MPSFKALVVASAVTFTGLSSAAPILSSSEGVGNVVSPCALAGFCPLDEELLNNLPPGAKRAVSDTAADDRKPSLDTRIYCAAPPVMFGGKIISSGCSSYGGVSWKRSLDTRIIHPCSSAGQCTQLEESDSVENLIYRRSVTAEDEKLALSTRIVHPCTLLEECTTEQWKAGSNELAVFRRSDDENEDAEESTLNARIVHPCMVSNGCTTSQQWEDGNEGLIVYRSVEQ